MKTPRPQNDALDSRETVRYGRHLVLPEVGLEGQLRLRRASALVVGAGGLGSPVALYLAAAGVGRIGLVDFDEVDLSNLQRQILYGAPDVGRPKLDAARERLESMNPHVRVEGHAERLSADNAREILSGYDVIIDGTDNFPTRYLVNDACVLLGKPDVYGSIFRFEGQVSVFHAGDGPCYRCLFPEPPAAGAVPSCAEGGVLGVLPGVVGTIQATEALKLLLGRGRTLTGRLLVFDALEMRFRELALRRDRACKLCGDSAQIRDLVEYETICAAPPAGDATEWNISVTDLHRRMGERGLHLLDVRTAQEWNICRLVGASLIPVQELAERIAEVDPERDTVVYCHSGIRSAMAVALLREHGHRRVWNLTGGIDAWAAEIDPGMPRY